MAVWTNYDKKIKEGKCNLADVPRRKITKEMCEWWVNKYPQKINQVPSMFLTEELVEIAMKHDKGILAKIQKNIRTNVIKKHVKDGKIDFDIIFEYCDINDFKDVKNSDFWNRLFSYVFSKLTHGTITDKEQEFVAKIDDDLFTELDVYEKSVAIALFPSLMAFLPIQQYTKELFEQLLLLRITHGSKIEKYGFNEQFFKKHFSEYYSKYLETKGLEEEKRELEQQKEIEREKRNAPVQRIYTTINYIVDTETIVNSSHVTSSSPNNLQAGLGITSVPTRENSTSTYAAKGDIYYLTGLIEDCARKYGIDVETLSSDVKSLLILIYDINTKGKEYSDKEISACKRFIEAIEKDLHEFLKDVVTKRDQNADDVFRYTDYYTKKYYDDETTYETRCSCSFSELINMTQDLINRIEYLKSHNYEECLDQSPALVDSIKKR